MKRLTCAAVMLVAVFLVAQPAVATTYSIGMNGLGSFMKNGANYTGTFMFGMTGSWLIDIDDSLWPAQSDSTARFNYIWETFFADNYDNTPGAQAWYGYFNGLTLPTTPKFTFTTTAPGGILAGDITLTILVRDWNADGVLSQSEKHRNLNLSATLSVSPMLGTGAFDDLCGHGSVSSGNFNFRNPPLDDAIQIMGQVQTYICPTPVEDTTWGTIKSLYK